MLLDHLGKGYIMILIFSSYDLDQGYLQISQPFLQSFDSELGHFHELTTDLLNYDCNKHLRFQENLKFMDILSGICYGN